MPRLVLKSEAAPRSFELRPGLIRLGRRAENDIQLNHESVSSTHCEIDYNGEVLIVRDYGSTNGTFIDGQPVRQTELAVGQTLRLGDVELALEDSEIVVSVPVVDFRPPPPPGPLPDGSAACHKHGERPAHYGCSHCHKTWCAACIHDVHRVGGPSHKLCPWCSHHCERIFHVDTKKKRSILDIFKIFKRTAKVKTKAKG
jgi:hypothetical protein